MPPTLLLAAAAAVPATVNWSPKIALVMVACNIFAIAFGKLTMQKPSENPALPSPVFFGGMGLPGLLATTSLGHILGAGVILGLSSAGIL